MGETLVKSEEFEDSPAGRIPKDWEVVKLESLLSVRIEAYETRIRTEEAYREKLKLQKQGLIHGLLTGKMHVKNAGI